MGAPSCGPGVQDAPPREAIQTLCPRNPAGLRHCSPCPELAVLEALPQEGTQGGLSPRTQLLSLSLSSLGARRLEATSLGGNPGTQEGPRCCLASPTFQPGALGRGGDLGIRHPNLFAHPQLWVWPGCLSLPRRGSPPQKKIVSPNTQPWVGSLRHHLSHIFLSSTCSQRGPSCCFSIPSPTTSQPGIQDLSSWKGQQCPDTLPHTPAIPPGTQECPLPQRWLRGPPVTQKGHGYYFCPARGIHGLPPPIPADPSCYSPPL